jgi:predicted HTH domain antitoxin
MKNIIGKLDEILVDMGKYSNKEEVRKDALYALLRENPELKKDIAIELFKKNIVSLSRAAEIYGSNIEGFKEVLKERGIKIEVPYIPAGEIDKEIEQILSW